MNRLTYKSILAAFAVLMLAFAGSSCFADEVVLRESTSNNEHAIGDYSCSPCFTKLSGGAVELRGGVKDGTIELTAGELWQFFNDQGHESVNSMTLFVDVGQLPRTKRLSLSKLNFEIESPIDGHLSTIANLGRNSLVVPGVETSSVRPEAELRFDLGYDFMELFSPESEEIVRVSISSPIGDSLAPTFHLAADDNVFGQTNLGRLFLFVLFWGSVFLMLLRWMKPVREVAIPAAKTISPPVRRTA